MKSWTISFIRQWWPHMTLGSVLRYRDCILRETQGKLSRDRSVSLRMKYPIRGVVLLRELLSDFATFEEIFFEQVYKAVPAHVPQCRTIIDLGANIGLTSLYLAACYPSSKIFAVEPNPDNYSVLTANLSSLISAKRGSALQAALWGTETVLVVEQAKLPHRYNPCTVRESTPGEEAPISVRGLTIQRIMECSGFNEVDLLKVDIEGAETQLFEGDLTWLSRVGAIAIEFHDRARSSCNFDHIMKEHGFRIWVEGPHTVLGVSELKSNSDARWDR